MLRLSTTKLQKGCPALSLVRRWSSETQASATSTTATPKPPTLPESVDVVIIGGGSAGCQTLYHLSRRGVKAVLLEKSKLTAGTTWHTSGLLWRLRPSDVEVQLLNATRNLFMSLEAETGVDPGWVNNGGMYIANNKERLDEYKRLASVAKSFNIEASVVSPSEMKGIFPLLDESVVVGGLYCPGDGGIDPTGLCTALTRAARKYGAHFVEDCPVTNIHTAESDFGPRKVTAVQTPYGTIKTECVVNCSGVWSREVAEMVSVSLPLVPMKHAYVVTEPIKGARGLPNIRDHDGSIYFRVNGDSLMMGGYESNPVILEKVSQDFNFRLYELDWTAFSSHVQAAVKLCPQFETAGIKSTVCGPESFTPDHKPIMGEDPRLRGLYHNCGYNSAGMMLAGGCGEQMAIWITRGRPELHMFKYDIRRFCDEQTSNAAWTKERSHESYAQNYAIVFPHDEPLAGRNLITGPFHEELETAGAFFEERQGWERPGWFNPSGPAPVPKYDWYGNYGSTRHPESKYEKLLKGDYTLGFSAHHKQIGEECLACREQVALFDLSYFSKLYLTGPDAQRAADWLFTANTKHTLGRTVYTCALNAEGGVEADMTVSAIETGNGSCADPIFKGRGLYVVSDGASARHTSAHIHTAIAQKKFNVSVTNLTNKIGVLSIQGPNSRALLQPLVDKDLSDEAFPVSSTRIIRLAGKRLRAIRASFVGELGWELHIPQADCSHVYQALVEAGRAHGLRHAGFRAMYSLGAEKGNHLWNYDLRSDDNPIEAGLEFSCRTIGDYLGRGAVDSLRKKGIKRRLAYFIPDEQVQLWSLDAIYRDGSVVGFLRRGEYAYGLGASIGMGYVEHPEGRQISKEFLESGHYQLEVMGKRYDAKLHLRSPLDPDNKRIRGIYDEQLPIRK